MNNTNAPGPATRRLDPRALGLEPGQGGEAESAQDELEIGCGSEEERCSEQSRTDRGRTHAVGGDQRAVRIGCARRSEQTAARPLSSSSSSSSSIDRWRRLRLRRIACRVALACASRRRRRRWRWRQRVDDAVSDTLGDLTVGPRVESERAQLASRYHRLRRENMFGSNARSFKNQVVNLSRALASVLCARSHSSSESIPRLRHRCARHAYAEFKRSSRAGETGGSQIFRINPSR